MNAPLLHPLPLLELDVLRTFLTIAETQSFSTAAARVFRTPSAVSMQIKKLEETIGRSVFRRDARSVTLTPDGEVLVGYARRMLALNREAISRFVVPDLQGVVRLGSPDDFGERVLPGVLRRFAATHPTVMVDVVIDQSRSLKKRMQAGELDLIVVTCGIGSDDADVETVLTEPIVWVGVKGGSAHLCDPLPLSLWEEGCAWRAAALAALNAQERRYRVAFMSAHTAGQRSAVLSELAIAPMPKSFVAPDLQILGEDDGLPPLGTYSLGMKVAANPAPPVLAVADHFRATFEQMRQDA